MVLFCGGGLLLVITVLFRRGPVLLYFEKLNDKVFIEVNIDVVSKTP